jgi:hypothetical protein
LTFAATIVVFARISLLSQSRHPGGPLCERPTDGKRSSDKASEMAAILGMVIGIGTPWRSQVAPGRTRSSPEMRGCSSYPDGRLTRGKTSRPPPTRCD